MKYFAGLSSFFLSSRRRFDIHDSDITHPQERLSVAYRPDIRALIYGLLADGCMSQGLCDSLIRFPTALPSDEQVLHALEGSTAISLADSHTALHLIQHIQRTADADELHSISSESSDESAHAAVIHHQRLSQVHALHRSITRSPLLRSRGATPPQSPARVFSVSPVSSYGASSSSLSTASSSTTGSELANLHDPIVYAFVRRARADIPHKYLILKYAHPPVGVHGSTPLSKRRFAWTTAQGLHVSAMVWNAAAMTLPLLPALTLSTALFARALRCLLSTLYSSTAKRYPRPSLRGFSADNSRLPRRRGTQLSHSFSQAGVEGTSVAF